MFGVFPIELRLKVRPLEAVSAYIGDESIRLPGQRMVAGLIRVEDWRLAPIFFYCANLPRHTFLKSLYDLCVLSECEIKTLMFVLLG